MAYTRDEMEEAFAHYQRVAREAGDAHDWNAWADLFTEDATYIEHLYGEFRGRDAIKAWITKTMSTPPGSEMPHFPIEWYVIDEARGWVVCCIQNRMEDPGDGQIYQTPNWTLLKYAGNHQWNYEEDIYNPNEFGEMITAWGNAKRSR
jgi:hypothetical protein